MIEGGNYDVDVLVLSPTGTKVYDQAKQQYDNFQWVSDSEGEFTFCFSNEFSTFTHKLVYFDFQAGDEEMLLPDVDGPTALTQVGTTWL